jgi:hypothetical protein
MCRTIPALITNQNFARARNRVKRPDTNALVEEHTQDARRLHSAIRLCQFPITWRFTKRPTMLPHIKPCEDVQLEFIVAAVYDRLTKLMRRSQSAA